MSSHPCAICSVAIEDAPRTFPRTPTRIYCSPECQGEGVRRALRRSYAKHRDQRIADSKAWQAAHPDQHRANAAAYRERTPEMQRLWSRMARLKFEYGLSLDDYLVLWAAHEGMCGICGRSETHVARDGRIQPLSVDHDHTTGEIRGLLCAYCNAELGKAEKRGNITRHPEYAEYLQRGPIEVYS